jgi:hypothetical protein
MHRFTYTIHPVATGFCAKCKETGDQAEGADEAETLSALRETVIERLRAPNAVAPPSLPDFIEVSLTLAPPHEPIGPQGPGEA